MNEHAEDAPRAYGCSPDGRVKLATGCVWAFVLLASVPFIAMGLILPFTTGSLGPLWLILFGLVLGFLIALIPLVARRWAPAQFVVSPERICVERVAENIAIPMASVAEITVLEKNPAVRSWRIAASGGPYGFYGLFHNKELGTYTAYTTRGTSVALVTTKSGEHFVLSPDSIDAFVDDVRSYL